MSVGSPERGQKRNENNIDSKQINIQYKRYYVDVNENSRGRFIKIAELGSNYKGRIILTFPAAVVIRDKMTEMLQLIDLSKDTPPTGKETVLVKSDSVTVDSRRFYLDLKENERGRFLRIAQMPQNPRQERQQIAIPSSGVAEIRNTLVAYIDKYDEGRSSEPESKYKFSAENKTFLFSPGSNDRGEFMRISEIKLNSGYRTSITVPMSAIEEFAETMKRAKEN